MEKGGQMDIIPKKCKKHQICHNKMPPTVCILMYDQYQPSFRCLILYVCIWNNWTCNYKILLCFEVIKYKQVKLGDITGLD